MDKVVFHIDKICDFIKSRNLDSTMNILNQEIDIIDQSIMELTLKKRSIENRIKTINSALSLPLDGNVYKKCIFYVKWDCYLF